MYYYRKENLDFSNTLLFSLVDLGVGEFLPLDVDHVDVCKPSSQTDERYLKTAQFIQKLISKKPSL